MIPDGDPEHPAELLRKPRPVLLVEVRNDLRIAVREKRVALEAASHVAVVVQLAVLDRDDRPVLVRHGLMAARDVDDREAADAERDPVGDMCAAVARAAMDHEVCHRVEDRRCDDGPPRPGPSCTTPQIPHMTGG